MYTSLLEEYYIFFDFFKMFEVILALVVVIIFFYLEILWLKIALITLLILLVIPGIYAMVSGAPFVLTRKKQVKAILKLGDFSKKDRVVELGCGDGRIIRKIARLGVKEAVGYEFSVPTFWWAWARSFLAGGKEKIRFGNFWKKDFAGVNVLVCFLMQDAMLEFEKKIWPGLSSGTRVISNIFKMPGLKPDGCEDAVFLYVKCERKVRA